MTRHPHPLLYLDLLRSALREDLGGSGDLTTDAIVPEGEEATAELVSRGSGRIAGIRIALDTLRVLDPQLDTEAHVDDGSDVESGTTVARLSGQARAILSGERVALNLLGRLSGIATAARDAAAEAAKHGAVIAGTRKTTPGLRLLERYALRVGGATDHRFGLDDAVLIKDNHVAFAGGLRQAIERAQAGVGHMVKIEAEVDSLAQLEEALELGVDLVLLDNMSLDELRQAVRINDGRATLEASGGIALANIAEIAATGVNVLSIGGLTHSVTALDVALNFSGESK